MHKLKEFLHGHRSLKELLHGHRSLKHGRHGYRWQGIVLIASAFIIILLHIAAAYYFL
jgi:hypothetical protein